MGLLSFFSVFVIELGLLYFILVSYFRISTVLVGVILMGPLRAQLQNLIVGKKKKKSFGFFM